MHVVFAGSGSELVNALAHFDGVAATSPHNDSVRALCFSRHAGNSVSKLSALCTIMCQPILQSIQRDMAAH